MTPEELDEARAKEAERIWDIENSQAGTLQELAIISARLARENWTPAEPEPVNPDVLAFREWAASQSEKIGWTVNATAYRQGLRDDCEQAQAYLSGARMAREQERERAKPLVEYVRGYACPESEGADILAKYLGEA